MLPIYLDLATSAEHTAPGQLGVDETLTMADDNTPHRLPGKVF
jgi:hypothetical protein